MKFGILRDKFKLKSSKVCILYLNIGLGILRAELKDPWDFEIEIEPAPQNLVFPPFALVTALILLSIEFMRALICLMGMLFHCSSRALVNWARIAGGGWCYPTGPIDVQSGTNRGYMAANRVVKRQHNLTLQQDNARPHMPRICQVFLANNNVQPLDWPPYSPDLSPLEHLWDLLDSQVRQRQPPPAARAQLTRALVEDWNNIHIRWINALMNSMDRRIRAVTRANGGHTRY